MRGLSLFAVGILAILLLGGAGFSGRGIGRAADEDINGLQTQVHFIRKSNDSDDLVNRTSSPTSSTLHTQSVSHLSNSSEAVFHHLLREATKRTIRPEYDGGRFSKWVTFVPFNFGFFPMAKSLHHHLNTIIPPLRNVVWFALDDAAYNGMRAFDPDALVFRDKDKSINEKDFDTASQHFRTKGYNNIVHHKWYIVQKVLQAGYNILLLDADVVIMRNPINYFIDGPECDLYVSVDGETQNWDRLDEYRYSATAEGWFFGIYVNTGMMFLRATNVTLSMVEEFLLPRYRIGGMDDQTEFNVYLQHRANYTKSKYTLPKFQQTKQCSFVSGVPTLILPNILFGNTKHFEKFEYNARSGIVPYTYHYNYFSGFDQKQEAMSKNGHYFGGN